MRQERDGLLVGPYEEGVHVRSEWGEGPPANFAFDLFPPALDRLEGVATGYYERARIEVVADDGPTRSGWAYFRTRAAEGGARSGPGPLALPFARRWPWLVRR